MAHGNQCPVSHYCILKISLRSRKKNNIMETLSAGKMVLFSNNKCLICFEGEDEYNLGILHDLQVFSVHYLCLLTGINSYPSTYNEGLLGYLLGDIYSVYKTYLNRTCEHCKKYGASLECSSCKIKYHLPCGIKNGARLKMMGTYPSYCKDCALDVFPKSDKLMKLTCVICYCPAEKDDILFQPTCCKSKRMIHFNCLKLYALSAGYLMRCPVCMNTTKFRSTTRKFGVYIPNSDADWLIEKPDKFISYPLSCCATVCTLDIYSEMSTALTPCIICDQKVAHVECTFSSIYLCMDCTRKMWPDIGMATLKNDQIGNLSETFPWFFRLVQTPKYGESLQGALNKILKVLGKKLKRDKCVAWHKALDVRTSNLIASKILECYEDSVSGNSSGEPLPKKMKR